jgi:hypothetical protein
MIEHPNTVLPPEARAGAYEALVAALASYEPEALARAAAAIEDEARDAARPSEESPAAATLARAWIAFSGHLEPVVAPEGAKVYSFAFPGTVGFDMVGTAGERAATRRAQRAVAALIELDRPLCAVQGPLPEDPSILNLEIWLGTGKDTDELTIEHVE